MKTKFLFLALLTAIIFYSPEVNATRIVGGKIYFYAITNVPVFLAYKMVL